MTNTTLILIKTDKGTWDVKVEEGSKESQAQEGQWTPYLIDTAEATLKHLKQFGVGSGIVSKTVSKAGGPLAFFVYFADIKANPVPNLDSDLTIGLASSIHLGGSTVSSAGGAWAGGEAGFAAGFAVGQPIPGAVIGAIIGGTVGNVAYDKYLFDPFNQLIGKVAEFTKNMFGFGSEQRSSETTIMTFDREGKPLSFEMFEVPKALTSDVVVNLDAWKRGAAYPLTQATKRLDALQFPKAEKQTTADWIASMNPQYGKTFKMQDKEYITVPSTLTTPHWGGYEYKQPVAKASAPVGSIPNPSAMHAPIHYDTYPANHPAASIIDKKYLVNPRVEKGTQHVLNARNFISPLVIDMDRNGKIDLRHAYDPDRTPVRFDIDNDGMMEVVGWTLPGDGQLAMDRNGNGLIDNITELYGDDMMPAFDKLRKHDANGDRTITPQDPDYATLLVWRDLNQNGVSEAEELQTLAQAGIASIDLNDTPDRERWLHENYLSSHASVQWKDGGSSEIADVHYLNDNLNSWYLGAHSQVFGANVTLNTEALMLPQSRGYGLLPSWHIAMSQDPILRRMIQDFDRLQPSEASEIPDKIRAIIWRWAGVEDKPQDGFTEFGRNNLDARYTHFMEKISGTEWLQQGKKFTGVMASRSLLFGWNKIVHELGARLLIQGPWKDWFAESSYDFVNDRMVLPMKLSTVLDRATKDVGGNAPKEFWHHLAAVLTHHHEALGSNLPEINDAIKKASGHDLSLVFFQLEGEILTGKNGQPDRISSYGYQFHHYDAGHGSAANDMIQGRHIYGDAGNDFLQITHHDAPNLQVAPEAHGGAGNDWIQGSPCNDMLYGNEGNDVLVGSSGEDQLYGGLGDDVLIGGPGRDILEGGPGYNKVGYYDSTGPVYVDLARGIGSWHDAEGDHYYRVQVVEGSRYDNRLIGATGTSSLIGADGNDYLEARGTLNNMQGCGGADIFVIPFTLKRKTLITDFEHDMAGEKIRFKGFPNLSFEHLKQSMVPMQLLKKDFVGWRIKSGDTVNEVYVSGKPEDFKPEHFEFVPRYPARCSQFEIPEDMSVSQTTERLTFDVKVQCESQSGDSFSLTPYLRVASIAYQDYNLMQANGYLQERSWLFPAPGNQKILIDAPFWAGNFFFQMVVSDGMAEQSKMMIMRVDPPEVQAMTNNGQAPYFVWASDPWAVYLTQQRNFQLPYEMIAKDPQQQALHFEWKVTAVNAKAQAEVDKGFDLHGLLVDQPGQSLTFMGQHEGHYHVDLDVSDGTYHAQANLEMLIYP
jgi:hypothetical protein